MYHQFTANSELAANILLLELRSQTGRGAVVAVVGAEVCAKSLALETISLPECNEKEENVRRQGFRYKRLSCRREYNCNEFSEKAALLVVAATYGTQP